jgi:hypothetical protein
MPWTMSGDDTQIFCPVLVGQKEKDKGLRSFGYITRVSVCLPDWDRECSKYIYLDVYTPATETVKCCRLLIAQLDKDFHHYYDDAIGALEKTTMRGMHDAKDETGEHNNEHFIRLAEDYIDNYYSVSNPLYS